MVDKHPIKPVKFNTAKKELGGGKIYKGRCTRNSKGVLVFEMAQKPPPTLARTLKEVIKRDAGLMLKVDVCKAADLTEDDDRDEADTPVVARGAAAARPPARDVGDAKAVPTATPEDPAADAGAKGEVTKRLTALAGAYTKMLKESVGNGPQATKLRQQLGTIKTMVAKQDWTAAKTSLDEMESLVAEWKEAQQQAAAESASAGVVTAGNAPGKAVYASSSVTNGIQKALKKLGYDPGAIDGIMGPHTQAAVKQFQQANGLVADGIMGPKTQAALAKALRGHVAAAGGVQARAPGVLAKTAAPVQGVAAGNEGDSYREPFPMDLNYKPKPLNGGISLRDSVGRRGKNLPGDVTEVQISLNRVAGAGLAISGKADDKTIAAIIAFQTSIGIPNPGGLVEVGGLTARKLAGGKVFRTDQVKPDEGGVIVGSAQRYQDTVKQAARDISKQARINASKFARRVSAGCDDFMVFAKSKIDKLKESEKARHEMIDLLAKAFSTAVGAGVMSVKGHEVAKYVVDKILDVLRDKIVAEADSLAKGSRDFEDLVNNFVQRTKDRANAIEDLVAKAVDERSNRIITAMNNSQPLSKEDDAFIEPFLFANVTDADALLERQLGIPGAARAKKVQLDILRGLVAAFMKQYLTETDSPIGRIVRNSTPGEDAAVFAAKYTKARERHLDEVDNRVQAALDKKQTGSN
jgi:peptidoglycan hydrolase-like protein with peptidoglycan-binding domain